MVAKHESGINTAVFSNDGTQVLTASDDGTAQIWDLQQRRIGEPFSHSNSPVTCAAFSADGKYVVTGGEDKTAVIWIVETGKQLVYEDKPLRLSGHGQPITSVAFSPDGKRIITGSQDRTAKLWDARTGNELLTLRGHQGSVTSVAFSEVDGKPKYVLTGSADNTARIWLATPRQEKENVAANLKRRAVQLIQN